MRCMRLAANTGRKKSRQKSPSGHHRTTLSGYIFAIKARIDNRKKNLLSINISSTCPYNMVNFGPLTAGIGSTIWGTPANFNGFRVLAVLLHSTLVVGVSQTLRRWTEGATYIRQGGHHVGHWPTFLVLTYSRIMYFWTKDSENLEYTLQVLSNPKCPQLKVVILSLLGMWYCVLYSLRRRFHARSSFGSIRENLTSSTKPEVH